MKRTDIWRYFIRIFWKKEGIFQKNVRANLPIKKENTSKEWSNLVNILDFKEKYSFGTFSPKDQVAFKREGKQSG